MLAPVSRLDWIQPSGWASPTLHTGDVPSMVNGTQLPVVFGVNCSSAQFDIPGVPSFVEQQVMKPDGGAFAGFGDTRVSPTWPNNHMAYGFFDAMFPELKPSYGSDTATARLVANAISQSFLIPVVQIGAKVEFRDDFTTDDLERVADEAEQRMLATFPGIDHVFLDPTAAR